MPRSSPEPPRAAGNGPDRLRSLDILRGFVMLLMAIECIRPERLASGFPPLIRSLVVVTFTHTAWAGCHPLDLIQPLFLFIAGVAIAFVVQGRRLKKIPRSRVWWHGLRRAAILVSLGLLIRMVDQRQYTVTFDDVLAQLGLAYVPALMVAELDTAFVWLVAATILVADWGLFTLYPVAPGSDVFAHWQRHGNVAAAFDTWFLNLWPRSAPFTSDPGGYTTLNFLPTISTLLFGTLAGRLLLQDNGRRHKVVRLYVFGAVAIALGVLLHVSHLCPIVKRLWSPAWVVFSAGFCAAALATSVFAFEGKPLGRLAKLALAVGRNSLLAYLLFTVGDEITTGFASRVVHMTGAAEPLFSVVDPLRGLLLVTGSVWLLCFMYRRHVFVRL